MGALIKRAGNSILTQWNKGELAPEAGVTLVGATAGFVVAGPLGFLLGGLSGAALASVDNEVGDFALSVGEFTSAMTTGVAKKVSSKESRDAMFGAAVSAVGTAQLKIKEAQVTRENESKEIAKKASIARGRAVEEARVKAAAEKKKQDGEKVAVATKAKAETAAAAEKTTQEEDKAAVAAKAKAEADADAAKTKAAAEKKKQEEEKAAVATKAKAKAEAQAATAKAVAQSKKLEEEKAAAAAKAKAKAKAEAQAATAKAVAEKKQEEEKAKKAYLDALKAQEELKVRGGCDCATS